MRNGPAPLARGAGPFHVKQRPRRDSLRANERVATYFALMKPSRSRTSAAFGLAPTIVFTTSPPW